MTFNIDALNAEALALLRRHNLLRTLVQRELVDDAARHTILSEEEKTEARDSFFQANRLQTPEDIETHLTQMGLDPEDLDHQILRACRTQKHWETNFQAKAEAHFLTRKSKLDKVVYSMLRVKDVGLARELFLRIDNWEANFADIAAAHSEGPERATKGIVGPVSLTQMHPFMAELLRTSSPGNLNEPFQIDGWWVVTRIESFTPAIFSPDVAKQMSRELFFEWVQEEVDIQMGKLPRV